MRKFATVSIHAHNQPPQHLNQYVVTTETTSKNHLNHIQKKTTIGARKRARARARRSGSEPSKCDRQPTNSSIQRPAIFDSLLHFLRHLHT